MHPNPNPTQTKTQPVSAVAIVKLVEQGKLSLNDTVAQYLPEWKNMEVCMPWFMFMCI